MYIHTYIPYMCAIFSIFFLYYVHSYQETYKFKAMRGFACDRHLFGLYLMAKYTKMNPLPTFLQGNVRLECVCVVCVYVCVECVCVCCVCVCVCCVCVCVCVVCVHACMHVCVHACMHACVHRLWCVCEGIIGWVGVHVWCTGVGYYKHTCILNLLSTYVELGYVL